jgi:mRNA interferase MazF
MQSIGNVLYKPTNPIGVDHGPKHNICKHCDVPISLPKSNLTNFVGLLAEEQLLLLNAALKLPLDIFE